MMDCVSLVAFWDGGHRCYAYICAAHCVVPVVDARPDGRVSLAEWRVVEIKATNAHVFPYGGGRKVGHPEKKGIHETGSLRMG